MTITERLEAIEQALKRIEAALGIEFTPNQSTKRRSDTDPLRWPYLPPHSPANTLPDVGKA